VIRVKPEIQTPRVGDCYFARLRATQQTCMLAVKRRLRVCSNAFTAEMQDSLHTLMLTPPHPAGVSMAHADGLHALNRSLRLLISLQLQPVFKLHTNHKGSQPSLHHASRSSKHDTCCH
jgi:hypothetical protein